MGENTEMLNSDETLHEELGIIPRFCHDLFEKVSEVHAENETKESKCHIATEISYIEIYNEKLYDLVGWQQNITDCAASDDKREALRVREHPKKGPIVVGASSHLVTSYQDVHTWLVLGNQQRSIAATAMNDKSSRSHSVFSITLTRTMVETVDNELMTHDIISKINIVDLAGSERIGTSFTVMDRLKEGVCINKSLLTLGKVITALAENPGKKKNFIPYRDSILTWLLKESLGGNSKTSMIATISPCNVHQEETLSTLRYAQQARKIINWNHINEDPAATMIRNLKLELERLRARSLGSGTRLDFNSSSSEPENSDSENVAPKREDEEKQKLQEEALERQRREGQAELELLKMKLRKTQNCLTERTQEYERKLTEANEQKKEALEMCRMSGLALKIEDNQPALVNLCEDPQLSQTLMYTLKKGDTTLGQSNADVSLANLHENNIHCTICNKNGTLVLFPNPESKTYVNGKLTTGKTEIYHNDRIVLSGIYYFRVNWPQKRTNSTKESIDFFYVRDELLKEQEERIKRDLEEMQERDKEEMRRQLEDLRQQASEMQTVSDELELERAEAAKIKLDRLKLQEENLFLQQKKQLEENFADVSIINPEQFDVGSDFFLEMDNILDQTRQTVDHDVSQITVNDLESWFIITEANGLCSKLKKPYEFNLQSQLIGGGIENFVLAKDKEHELVAGVSVATFKQITQVLRDLASGMQEDDGSFESFFEWKREQDMSRLPSVMNKIKQNHKRYSMNSTLNNSIMRPPPPKKLSVGKGISSKVPNCSVSMAKAVYDALESTNAVSPNHTVCEAAVSSICHLLDILQSFRPNALKLINLEEELGTLLVQMAVSSQAVSTAMSRMILVQLPQACKKANDFHDAFATAGLKVTRLVQRISKGFQTETLALAVDESKNLSAFMNSLLEEIGYVCVLGDSLVREPFELCARYHSFCQLYLIGVTKGLEWQLDHANQSAKNAAAILSNSFENSPRAPLLQRIETKAKKAATSIASFLDTFSALNVTISLDSGKSAETTATEAMRFLYRVKLASDNFKQVTSGLASIIMELQKLDGRPDISILRESACALEESLRELIEDAGIGPSYDRNAADCSTDSTKSLLDSLGVLAIQTVRALQSFASAVDQYDNKTKSARAQKRSSDHTPYKSALRTSSKEGENKKVRFESVVNKVLDD